MGSLSFLKQTTHRYWPFTVHLLPTLWIPWIIHTTGIWPCCRLEKKKTHWTHTKAACNRTQIHSRSHTQSHGSWLPEESTVSAAKVWFSQRSQQFRPSKLTVSVLIGLILGSLLQQLTTRIIIHGMSQMENSYLSRTQKLSFNCVAVIGTCLQLHKQVNLIPRTGKGWILPPSDR